jgi:hypothetical protein
VIIPGDDRRRIVHFNVARNPTQVWLARQMTEAFPWDSAARGHFATRAMAVWGGGSFNGSAQHLLILFDQEVADGDITDMVHGSSKGRVVGALEERIKAARDLPRAGSEEQDWRSANCDAPWRNRAARSERSRTRAATGPFTTHARSPYRGWIRPTGMFCLTSAQLPAARLVRRIEQHRFARRSLQERA